MNSALIQNLVRTIVCYCLFICVAYVCCMFVWFGMHCSLCIITSCPSLLQPLLFECYFLLHILKYISYHSCEGVTNHCSLHFATTILIYFYLFCFVFIFLDLESIK